MFNQAIHEKTYLLFFSLSLVSKTLRPINCSTPGFPVPHYLPEIAQNHGHYVYDAIQPSHPLLPLLLLPSIFPSIRVFSNDLALRIMWPKYWQFNISPYKKYSGLISFRIDRFDLLAVQGTLLLIFSIVAMPIYIPTNSVQRIIFLHTLTNTYLLNF